MLFTIYIAKVMCHNTKLFVQCRRRICAHDEKTTGAGKRVQETIFLELSSRSNFVYSLKCTADIKIRRAFEYALYVRYISL